MEFASAAQQGGFGQLSVVLTDEGWISGAMWTSSGCLGNVVSSSFLSRAARPSSPPTRTLQCHTSHPPFLSPFLWLVTNYYSTLRTLFWDMGDGKERDRTSVSLLGFLVGDG